MGGCAYWVWLLGMVTGWVWLLGMVTMVVRRYIDFLILLIPTLLVSFLQQHPYFFFIFKLFFHMYNMYIRKTIVQLYSVLLQSFPCE